jgi:hypothetical protein
MPSTEQHPHFPSGDWEGFYTDPRGSRPRGEMSMTLDFSGGTITGSGSDPVGAYAWTGSYDTKAETCTLRKTYVGKHSVEYSGYADENGIWGKWNIRNLSAGGFHIWPKKHGSGSDSEEEKEEVNETTLTMVNA